MEDSYPEEEEYLRHYIRAHAIQKHIDLIKVAKSELDLPIIASINCIRDGEWVHFAKELEKAGADALELNVFLLETDLTYDYQQTLDLYIQLIRKVKETVSIPIMVKISKMVGNIPALVHTLTINGADAVVLFNRFYQPDIDIHSLKVTANNVFSQPSDLSDTLRWTAIVSGKIQGISIASSTGIHEWEDVIKCLLAGADAVQLCSTIYKQGSEIISQILTCLEEWMSQKKYQSIDEFKGKLSYTHIANPSLYERAQFMKYHSNRK
jgi:dihydroorotate dehydrogenase (fumarate)